MRCSLREDLNSGFRCSQEPNSEEAWKNRLIDEMNADLPGHEDYFEGSSDNLNFSHYLNKISW